MKPLVQRRWEDVWGLRAHRCDASAAHHEPMVGQARALFRAGHMVHNRLLFGLAGCPLVRPR